MTQASASIGILISLFTIKNSPQIRTIFLITALFLKIGAAPFHQWVVSISPGLRWQSLILLLVPQKIAPLILVSTTCSSLKTILFSIFIVRRALTGRLGGLLVTSLKKIIVFSSITHLSWLLTSILIQKRIWIIYFTVYSLITLSIISSFSKINLLTISRVVRNKKKNTKNFIVINLLSLAGLPPFSGFLIKIIVTIELTRSNLALLLPLLLSRTIISLFFYIRVAISNIFFASQKTKIRQKKSFHPWVAQTNLAGLVIAYPLILILDFKLYKLKAFKALKKESLRSRKKKLNLKLYKLKAFQALKKEPLRFKL